VTEAQTLDLAARLADREIIVCAGSGGVGKTTISAALGVAIVAEFDKRVLVLTVDPARRLATALGLEALGNQATRVALPTDARGELWAAMLDMKLSWDDLVRRHAPDAPTRDAILANPLYRNITTSFVQGHDYVAMERLYELHVSGEWDLIVLDTPPSRHAVDFLDAPERMADFFSSRFLRLLIAPYRSRFVNAASRPFYTLADRLLGSAFLQDIADFFILFQSMYAGFVERAHAVERVLHDRRTSFTVVTTLEPGPTGEADFLLAALGDRKLHVGGVVLNKVLPPGFLDAGAEAAAAILEGEARRVGAALPASLGPRPQLERVLGELGRSFHDFALVARREAEQRAELAADADAVVGVPHLDDAVTDLDGLLRLAAFLG
jgi:anion-transporting  ArsA/GET3 family ATPase